MLINFFEKTFIFSLFFFGLFNFAEALTYYSSSTLVSKNVLEGKTLSSIDYFGYKATIPTSTTLKVQFSQDLIHWYSSTGTLNGWDILQDGDHLSTSSAINLSNLNWKLPYFFYKIRFETEDTSTTPILDEVKVYYTPATSNTFYYYSSSTLVSKNVLEGKQVLNITTFFVSSSVPVNTALWVQFATTSAQGPWFSAYGRVNEWTFVPNGETKFVLTPLELSGPNFYYRMKLESFNENYTPMVDEIILEYNISNSPQIKGRVKIKGGTKLK